MSQDATAILFGLCGVKMRGVDRAGVADRPGEVEGPGRRLVHVLTDDPSEGACPECGVLFRSVRQRRTTRPWDLPYGEQALSVRWQKTQWTCREAACPRTGFTDQIAELQAGARVTGRLRRHVALRVADGLAVSVAGGALLSWPIAHAAHVVHADALLAEPAPVLVLGIDETRRGRPVWTQHEQTRRWTVSERFETNFDDLAADQGAGVPGSRPGPVVPTLRRRGRPARQRHPPAGARAVRLAPDHAAGHALPLPVPRLRARPAAGPQPGRAAAGQAHPRRAALGAIVCQHLTVARVAGALGVAWNTANDAVLAEGQRVLIADPSRFEGVRVIGVDEHVWRHTRRGDKYVTVIIDLTGIRDGIGPARLLRAYSTQRPSPNSG